MAETQPQKRDGWATGTCKKCGATVFTTGAIGLDADYWWYCSNKECEYYEFGERLYDQDEPEWVKRG